MVQNCEANYKGFWSGSDGGLKTFDNLKYVDRFMVDTGVSFSIPKESERILTIQDIRYVLG